MALEVVTRLAAASIAATDRAVTTVTKNSSRASRRVCQGADGRREDPTERSYRRAVKVRAGSSDGLGPSPSKAGSRMAFTCATSMLATRTLAPAVYRRGKLERWPAR